MPLPGRLSDQVLTDETFSDELINDADLTFPVAATQHEQQLDGQLGAQRQDEEHEEDEEADLGIAHLGLKVCH